MKDGKIIKNINSRDQVVAKALLKKAPCEVELAFDKMHVGPTLGDKYIQLAELGRGRLTLCTNVIGAINRYWGKVRNSTWRKGEPRELWGPIQAAKIEELRKMGKLKDGPLVEAIEEDDFIGGKLCGALMSLNSNYVELGINEEGVPALRKTSGDYFKSVNEGKV